MYQIQGFFLKSVTDDWTEGRQLSVQIHGYFLYIVAYIFFLPKPVIFHSVAICLDKSFLER